MGLLDKNTQILQCCLTSRGRELLAQNKLQIKYFALSDDDIDYQLLFNSGTYSDPYREQQILNTPIFEPIPDISKKSRFYDEDKTIQQRNLIYTMPNGQEYIPYMTVSTGSLRFGIVKSDNFEEFKESLFLDHAFTSAEDQRESLKNLLGSNYIKEKFGNKQNIIQDIEIKGGAQKGEIDIALDNLKNSVSNMLKETTNQDSSEISFHLNDFLTSKDGSAQPTEFKIEFFMSSSNDGLRKMAIRNMTNTDTGKEDGENTKIVISDYFDIEV